MMTDDTAVPAELADLAGWGRRAKEKAARVVLADGDIANAVDFWRGPARICRIATPPGPEPLLALLTNGIAAFDADAVTYAFDSWVTEVDPDAALSDRDQVEAAIAAGTRHEVLSVVHHRRDGAMRSMWLRYTHDRAARTITWEEPQVEPTTHEDGNGGARFPNVVARAFQEAPWRPKFFKLMAIEGLPIEDDEPADIQCRLDATFCLFAAAKDCTVLIGAKGDPLPINLERARRS